MSRPALVSIVIPCHNAAAQLEACLSSCLAQTYPQLEIIVVDHHSSDNSVAIAHQLAARTTRPFRVLHCPQRGANHARNFGFTQAQGDYIQWLDANGTLERDKIALQVTALAQQPQFDIACSAWEWCFHDPGAGQWQLDFPAQCWDDPRQQHLLHHWHPPHAYLLRRAAADRLQAIPAWNPDSPIATDREYFTWAALIGCRFLAVPGAKVADHYGPDSCGQAAPYPLRVQTLEQMFTRFRQHAQTQTSPQLTSDHWFLLKQNWELWQLAPAQITQPHPGYCWLQHQTEPNGITLSPTEANLVVALNQLGGTFTLEDHAYRLLRQLWRQIRQQWQIGMPEMAIALSRVVGLQSTASRSGLPMPMRSFNPALDIEPQPFIDAIPLHAPLFPEIRIALLQFLDQLRGAGLLQSRSLNLESVSSSPPLSPPPARPQVEQVVIQSWFGELGNNLFQLARAKLLSEQLGACLSFPAHPFLSLEPDQGWQDCFNNAPHSQVLSASRILISEGKPTLVGAFYYDCDQFPFSLQLRDWRRMLLTQILPLLPSALDPRVTDETLVIHIRSGDIFQGQTVHPAYVQPPLSFYLKIIETFHFQEIVIVTQPDLENPCIAQLKQRLPQIRIQASSLTEDVRTILSARNLVTGLSTFSLSLGFASRMIRRLYVPQFERQPEFSRALRWPDVFKLTVQERERAQEPDLDFELWLGQILDYIPIGGWCNRAGQRDLMLCHGQESIVLRLGTERHHHSPISAEWEPS